MDLGVVGLATPTAAWKTLGTEGFWGLMPTVWKEGKKRK